MVRSARGSWALVKGRTGACPQHRQRQQVLGMSGARRISVTPGKSPSSRWWSLCGKRRFMFVGARSVGRSSAGALSRLVFGLRLIGAVCDVSSAAVHKSGALTSLQLNLA